MICNQPSFFFNLIPKLFLSDENHGWYTRGGLSVTQLYHRIYPTVAVKGLIWPKFWGLLCHIIYSPYLIVHWICAVWFYCRLWVMRCVTYLTWNIVNFSSVPWTRVWEFVMQWLSHYFYVQYVYANFITHADLMWLRGIGTSKDSFWTFINDIPAKDLRIQYHGFKSVWTSCMLMTTKIYKINIQRMYLCRHFHIHDLAGLPHPSTIHGRWSSKLYLSVCVFVFFFFFNYFLIFSVHVDQILMHLGRYAGS